MYHEQLSDRNRTKGLGEGWPKLAALSRVLTGTLLGEETAHGHRNIYIVRMAFLVKVHTLTVHSSAYTGR